jgi:glycerol-3-phosphate dehydrogenase
MPGADFEAFHAALAQRHPWMPAKLLHRWARAYGTRTGRLLEGARSVADLGEEVVAGLHAREIDYLRHEEWATTAEDILYRRSKLALHLPSGSSAHLDEWLRRHPPAGPAGGSLV